MNAEPSPFLAARMFTHEAMNTTFSLYLAGLDDDVARSVAHQCFERVDLIESRLSRFIDGSDVSRINRLAAGETLYLTDTCHECLLRALHGCADTGGLFDITLGARIAHCKSGADGPAPPLAGRLVIHPDTAAITCEEPGREIDLGGIGKGFALDQLGQLLEDWEVGGAFLTAGASSMLAFGSGSWPVELAGDRESLRIDLAGQSLSVSGTGIQGAHIIHPWGAEAMPVAPFKRLWVTAPEAALAEIWSTALMLVEPQEIADYLPGPDVVSGVYADTGDKLVTIR